MRNRIFAGTVALLLLGIAVLPARAEEPISTEKRALIKQLLEVTNSRENTNATIQAMLAQTEKMISQMVTGMALDDPKLTAAQRKQMQAVALQSAQRTSRRFNTLFKERIDFGQLVEDISYPLYNEYFTADELKDLITFYETPTGKKTITVMPQLAASSMTRTNERVMPQIQQIMRELMEDEKKEIERQRAARKPGKTPRRLK